MQEQLSLELTESPSLAGTLSLQDAWERDSGEPSSWVLGSAWSGFCGALEPAPGPRLQGNRILRTSGILQMWEVHRGLAAFLEAGFSSLCV